MALEHGQKKVEKIRKYTCPQCVKAPQSHRCLQLKVRPGCSNVDDDGHDDPDRACSPPLLSRSPHTSRSRGRTRFQMGKDGHPGIENTNENIDAVIHN